MSSFKVIVVGAGTTGLVLAHALQASDIDYVLVEKRSQIVPDRPFGVSLWPQVMRILHQLGLHGALEGFGERMTCAEHLTMDGKHIHQDRGFGLLEGATGYPMTLFNRGSLARVLLDGLKDREKHVKMSKRVINITNLTDGVTIDFQDGTSEEGSVVVGCDGIWSTVRDHMAKEAPEELFDSSPNPFEAPFTGIFATIPVVEGFEPGTIVHMHAADRLAQVFVSTGEGYLITYQRIENSKERTHFRHSDVENVGQHWLDARLSDKQTFGDLWKNKKASGTANFDEGVLNWWYWNRLVLVGDAAHKLGPIRGAGACSGIEDAIALTNHLKQALYRKPHPSKRELRQVFSTYQAEREPVARMWLNISQLSIDLLTSKTGPNPKTSVVADSRSLPLIVDAPILRDVPFDEKKGRFSFRRQAKKAAELEKMRARL